MDASWDGTSGIAGILVPSGLSGKHGIRGVLVTVIAALRLINLKPPRNHIDPRRRSIPGKHTVFHGLSAVGEPVAISKSERRLRSLAALSDEKMVRTSGMHLCVLAQRVACQHGLMQPARVVEE